MKKLVYIVLFLPLLIVAQTSTENYVLTKTYKIKSTDTIKKPTKEEVTTSIQYFDGLGRIKQSVLVEGGGIVRQKNDAQYDWTMNNMGSTDFYNQNGSTAENSIVNGSTPFGDNDLLWECKPDTGSGPSGGWNSDFFTINQGKSYRYSVWVKKTGSTDGITYHGIQNVNNLENLGGSFSSNPYFWSGDLPQLNTWYLLVGIVHPKGYTGSDIGITGVYDINGTKVLDGTEYKWADGYTTTRLRSYLYYATDTNARQYFWSPLFQEIDGTELSINDIVNTSRVVLDDNLSAKDIVTHYEYDEFGRQIKDYLPYASNTNGGNIRNGDIAGITNEYYHAKYTEDFAGVTLPEYANAYSEKTIEKSPLNRVFEQGAPGKDWKINTTQPYLSKGYSDNSHTIKFEYDTNTLLEVKIYYVTTIFANNTYSPTLQGGTNTYNAGELTKTITKDENWSSNQTHIKDHTTEEFKNKQGQVVLKRTYNNNDPHDTFYVYDDFGNLTYVLPPKMDANTNSITTIISQLNDLGYQYKYDYRNRLVEKKIPGKGWENIVYDKLDRPVITSDINQYSTAKWSFTKYDALGRVIYTGNRQGYTDRNTLQNEANNTAAQYENRGTSSIGGTLIHYTNNNSFPNTNLQQVYTVNYYDTYVDLPTGLTSTINTSYEVTSTTNTKGLPTVSKVRVLDTNNWITTVTYYDEKARPIYVYSKNDYLNTVDIVESKLDDFTGKVLETKTTHSKTGNPTIITIDRFEYDHMDRLISQSQQINNQPSERIVKNNYDELGQLESKLVGNGTKNGYSDALGVSVSQGVITKTASNSWTNGGLTTSGSISGDGYVEFTTPITYHYYMTGLSTPNTDINFPSIKYAIYNNGGQYGVYESGTNRGNFGTYNVGDVFKVQRIANKIYYKRNDEIFYVSTTTSDDVLVGDMTIHSNGGKIANLHIVDNENGLQKIDYKYNVRGWLKQINEDNDDDNDLFNFTLRYNNPTSGTKLFNGNISQTSWNTANIDSSIKTYSYSYDALNRITNATDNTGNYNLNSVGYDKNGNILSLSRNGHTNVNATNFGLMDNLSYTYNNGNRLLKVDDVETNGYGFKDVSNASNDYTYDDNGNMLSDQNKSITNISYNHLNLPTSVTFDSNVGDISYVYDATGVKQEKRVFSFANGWPNTTLYAGNYTYVDEDDGAGAALQFFNHPEGYVKNDNGVYNYVYQYKDHLGNVRLSYSDSNKNGEVRGSYTNVYVDGFEDTSNWSTTSGISFGGSPLSAFDTSFKRSGNSSGRIDSNYPTQWERYVFSNKVVNINNTVNTDYIISGWVYLEDISGNQAQFFLAMRNAGNTGWPNYSTITDIVTTKGSWVYIEKRVTVPASVRELFFRIDNDKAGKVWFDDLKIQEANDISDIEIIEESNYYPFGLKHKGYNNVVSSNGNSVAQKWGFTGKEHQDELGLGWIDITARNYDAALGRWMNIDPLAEKMRRHSPYNYAFNSPIYFMDPDGMCPNGNCDPIEEKIEKVTETVQKVKQTVSTMVSNAFDWLSENFVLEASAKATVGVQAGVKAKIGGVVEVKAKANIASVEIASGKADLTDPINPDSYTGDYAGKDGNVDITHGVSLTAGVVDKPIVGAEITASHSSDSEDVDVNGGVYLVAPLVQTKSPKGVGPVKVPSKKPSAKAKTGNKGSFYGLNLGAGAAFIIGVDVNLKVGFNI